MYDKVEKLSSFVKSVRKEQGLTQEQLAAASGVGVRFIRDLERGKETCQLGKTLKVLAMLGLDIHIGGKKL